jgi:hypothetical protein
MPPEKQSHRKPNQSPSYRSAGTARPPFGVPPVSAFRRFTFVPPCLRPYVPSLPIRQSTFDNRQWPPAVKEES